jgi:hypothetical protein
LDNGNKLLRLSYETAALCIGMVRAGVSERKIYDEVRPVPDTTGDFNLWKSQVCRAIAGLCEIENRPGGGLREAIDGASDFHQALNRLYADSHFTEFLSWQAWRQAGLDESVGQELLTLQQLLDAYDEPASDAAVLLDPKWWVIMGQAKTVVALLTPAASASEPA